MIDKHPPPRAREEGARLLVTGEMNSPLPPNPKPSIATSPLSIIDSIIRDKFFRLSMSPTCPIASEQEEAADLRGILGTSNPLRL